MLRFSSGSVVDLRHVFFLNEESYLILYLEVKRKLGSKSFVYIIQSSALPSFGISETHQANEIEMANYILPPYYDPLLCGP